MSVCLSYFGPKIWNSLPSDLKSTNDINLFQHKIKGNFFQNIQRGGKQRGRFFRFCGGSMKLTLTPPPQQTMFSFVAKGLKLRLTRIFSNLPLFIRVFAWSIVDTFLSRPLGKQFVLGLKEGMKRNKDSSRKDVIKHRKNFEKSQGTRNWNRWT